MKKNNKYILISSLALLGSITSTNYANATIRGRLSSMFSSILRTNSRNINTPEEKFILQNIKVNSNLKEDAKNLARDLYITGTGSRHFDLKEIGEPSKKFYYHQNINDSGKLYTLISKNKPRITSINGDKIEIKYKDTSGNKVNVVNNGLPIWVKGKSIIKNNKDLLKNTETSKIDDQVNEPSAINYITLDTFKISKDFEKETKDLINKGKMHGIGVTDFNTEKIKQLKSNYYYHQKIDDNGIYRTQVSVGLPTIVKVDGNTVTTKFMNSSGKKINLETTGIPIWVKGQSIINFNKYQEEKQKLKTPSPINETPLTNPVNIETIDNKSDSSSIYSIMSNKSENLSLYGIPRSIFEEDDSVFNPDFD